MNAIQLIVSKTVVLPQNDIDTDQIIPARFLTTTQRDGLGVHAFADWRYGGDGQPRADCVLNQPDIEQCHVLVAGENFGCGSSREHAPWALLDFGIEAVVSSGIADIFRANSLKNGLVPVIVDAASHQWLLEHPGAPVEVDVEATELRFDGRSVTFPIDAFSRYCLLNGIDQLGFLLENEPAISAFERRAAAPA
ncbi:MAG TPA: 3-isopropylmalate dehydratase small subunit [Gammaproteobacteria bacterium]|nr:3-isopropylmalate dehydratase small subunit [Gammaproteobacteria bacterium]